MEAFLALLFALVPLKTSNSEIENDLALPKKPWQIKTRGTVGNKPGLNRLQTVIHQSLYILSFIHVFNSISIHPVWPSFTTVCAINDDLYKIYPKGTGQLHRVPGTLDDYFNGPRLAIKTALRLSSDFQTDFPSVTSSFLTSIQTRNRVGMTVPHSHTQSTSIPNNNQWLDISIPAESFSKVKWHHSKYEPVVKTNPHPHSQSTSIPKNHHFRHKSLLR